MEVSLTVCVFNPRDRPSKCKNTKTFKFHINGCSLNAVVFKEILAKEDISSQTGVIPTEIIKLPSFSFKHDDIYLIPKFTPINGNRFLHVFGEVFYVNGNCCIHPSNEYSAAALTVLRSIEGFKFLRVFPSSSIRFANLKVNRFGKRCKICKTGSFYTYFFDDTDTAKELDIMQFQVINNEELTVTPYFSEPSFVLNSDSKQVARSLGIKNLLRIGNAFLIPPNTELGKNKAIPAADITIKTTALPPDVPTQYVCPLFEFCGPVLFIASSHAGHSVTYSFAEGYLRASELFSNTVCTSPRYDTNKPPKLSAISPRNKASDQNLKPLPLAAFHESLSSHGFEDFENGEPKMIPLGQIAEKNYGFGNAKKLPFSETPFGNDGMLRNQPIETNKPKVKPLPFGMNGGQNNVVQDFPNERLMAYSVDIDDSGPFSNKQEPYGGQVKNVPFSEFGQASHNGIQQANGFEPIPFGEKQNHNQNKEENVYKPKPNPFKMGGIPFANEYEQQGIPLSNFNNSNGIVHGSSNNISLDQAHDQFQQPGQDMPPGQFSPRPGQEIPINRCGCNGMAPGQFSPRPGQEMPPGQFSPRPGQEFPPGQFSPRPGQEIPINGCGCNGMAPGQFSPRPGQEMPPGQFSPRPGQEFPPGQFSPRPGQFSPRPGQEVPPLQFVQNQEQNGPPGQFSPRPGQEIPINGCGCNRMAPGQFSPRPGQEFPPGQFSPRPGQEIPPGQFSPRPGQEFPPGQFSPRPGQEMPPGQFSPRPGQEFPPGQFSPRPGQEFPTMGCGCKGMPPGQFSPRPDNNGDTFSYNQGNFGSTMPFGGAMQNNFVVNNQNTFAATFGGNNGVPPINGMKSPRPFGQSPFMDDTSFPNSPFKEQRSPFSFTDPSPFGPKHDPAPIQMHHPKLASIPNLSPMPTSGMGLNNKDKGSSHLGSTNSNQIIIANLVGNATPATLKTLLNVENIKYVDDLEPLCSNNTIAYVINTFGVNTAELERKVNEVPNMFNSGKPILKEVEKTIDDTVDEIIGEWKEVKYVIANIKPEINVMQFRILLRHAKSVTEDVGLGTLISNESKAFVVIFSGLETSYNFEIDALPDKIFCGTKFYEPVTGKLESSVNAILKAMFIKDQKRVSRWVIAGLKKDVTALEVKVNLKHTEAAIPSGILQPLCQPPNTAYIVYISAKAADAASDIAALPLYNSRPLYAEIQKGNIQNAIESLLKADRKEEKKVSKREAKAHISSDNEEADVSEEEEPNYYKFLLANLPPDCTPEFIRRKMPNVAKITTDPHLDRLNRGIRHACIANFTTKDCKNELKEFCKGKYGKMHPKITMVKESIDDAINKILDYKSNVRHNWLTIPLERIKITKSDTYKDREAAVLSLAPEVVPQYVIIHQKYVYIDYNSEEKCNRASKIINGK